MQNNQKTNANASQDTEQEHPAARRMREQFEQEYGRHHEIASALRRYYNVCKDFADAWNLDRETPVKMEDIRQAEREVFEAADRAARVGQNHQEGELVITKNEAGQIVAVTRQDEEGRILKVLAESEAQKGTTEK